VFVALDIQRGMRMAPYYHLWPVWLYYIIFFKFPHKRYDFRKKSYWTENVFWYSVQLLSETFTIL